MQLLVVGCWLLVVGGWLLVVGCWLLVVGCWLLVLLLLLLALVMHNKALEHLDSKPFNNIKPKLQQAPMEARNILLLPLGCLNAWAVRLNLAEHLEFVMT